MNDYDFKNLNDKEFEVLATDLLSKRDGVKYERYKPGKDGGIDGRFFSPSGNFTILQCKHWITTPLEKLIKNLKDKELIKIRNLNPDRYILILSNPLSANDKDVIAKILSPFIKTPSDILGKEDLNDILSLNKDIERRHYKLWISSTNVLNTLLNKAILDRSDFLLENIISNSHIYVETENHSLALEKLDKLGTVIITGPAGIGKTTLAEQLLLYYTANEYSLFFISEEIKEAESAFIKDDKQIFFFDDFLGRNYLEALSGHEGTHIVNFIQRIKKTKNKKFILTSRSTILNQGKSLIDVFHHNNIEKNEFEISFDSFSTLDKAKILYNHIWHSSLSEDYVDQLYLNKRYKEIINHPNYNPRIIKFITDSERLDKCDASKYWQYSKSLLDNPADVWSNPFEAQHDDFGRALILLVTLNSRAIEQGDLANAYARFLSLSSASNMHGRKDYLQQLKHLVGSMLSRTLSKKTSLINLFNPSIGDFILKRYSSDVPALREAFTCLRSTSSIKTIIDLHKNELINSSAKNEILGEILISAQSINYIGYDSEYISLAISNYYEDINSLEKTEIIETASKFLLNSDCPSNLKNALELVEWRHNNSLSPEIEIYKYIKKCINSAINFEEAAIISRIISNFDGELYNKAHDELEHALSDYLCDSAHDEFSENEVFSGVDPSSLEDAVDNLRDLITAKFKEIDINVSDSFIERIIDSYDIDNRFQNYFEYDDNDDYFDREKIHVETRFDEIEDLFERS